MPYGAIDAVLPDSISLRAVLIGGAYTGVFGSEDANSFSAGPALFLQDITVKDSASLLSRSILGKIRLEGRYFQPFGSFIERPQDRR